MSVTHSMSGALLRFCFFLLDLLPFVFAYTSSDFRAAAPDRQLEPSPQSRVCRLAPFGRELRTSPASVVGL